MNEYIKSIRPMTETERMYFYHNSQQIFMQTGHIGYLRADMDTDGNGFFSTWNDFRPDIKTDAFKKEFDEVINACRFDDNFGKLLGSRLLMKQYCCSHEDAGFEGNYTREYGFRVDTDKYSYLMRLNPTKGDYNLYCYCYEKKWLDNHLQYAEKGIRFITPHYEELFRIKDGEKVSIEYRNGEKRDFACRYIDDYHLYVGTSLYHICEFAERMEGMGKVSPVKENQPAAPNLQKKDRGEAR